MERPKFDEGQIIYHRMFGYRGVIIDRDETFQGTDEWYENMALTRPPRDRPWYHVLVHNASHQTYVAEQNLGQDDTGKPVRHPSLAHHFNVLREGRYEKLLN